VLEGKAEVTVDGNPVTAREGEILIIPADRPHALKAIERFRIMWVMIESRAVNNRMEPMPRAFLVRGVRIQEDE